MGNNNEEAALRRVAVAVTRVFRQFGFSEKQAKHRSFELIALFAALVVGSFSIVGGFQMLIPLALLVLAFIVGTYELVSLSSYFSWSGSLRNVFVCVLVAAMLACVWEEYHVFKIQMNIRMATGKAISGNAEQYTFEVELSNSGKATSLRDWKAELILADGTKIMGLPAGMHTESIEMQDQSRKSTYYKLPDCDLAIETTKAVQTGDSVYGIISFVFPGALPSIRDKRNRVELQATDMLGRRISSRLISFQDIADHERTVFPCFESDSLKSVDNSK